jgi:hypothetical protein
VRSECQPVEIARVGKDSVGVLRLDATHVYFHDKNEGTLWRVPKDTGDADKILNVDAVELSSVDDDFVYFTSPSQGAERVRKDGSDRVSIDSLHKDAVEVVTDKEFIYWANYGGPPAAPATVWRANKDGTNLTRLVPTDYHHIEAIVPDGEVVYFGENGDEGYAGIYRVSRNGGAAASVTGSPARRLAVDATDIWSVDYHSSDLRRVTKAGGNASTWWSAPTTVQYGDIAIDADAVYLAVPDDRGGLFRVAKAGGSKQIAPGIGKPAGVAVDDIAIYFSLRDTGQVTRLAR